MTDPESFPTLPPAPGGRTSPPPPPPYGGSAAGQSWPPQSGYGQPGGYPPGAYPPGAYPPGAYPPGSYPPGSYPQGGFGATPSRRNGMATAALVLGLSSILLFWALVPPLLAFIFGLIGASKAKRSGGAIGGAGAARAGWILGLLGLAGFVAIIVAAANGAFDDNTKSVFDLEVGHCYDVPLGSSDETTTVSGLEEIDCTQAHNAELFFEGELNPNQDREFPGDLESAINEAGNACVAPFQNYVSADDASKLQIYPLVADKAAWRITRGQYSCFAVVTPGEPLLTESVRNSDG